MTSQRWNRTESTPRSEAARARQPRPARLDARLEQRLATRAAEAGKEAIQRSISSDGDVLDRGYGHGV